MSGTWLVFRSKEAPNLPTKAGLRRAPGLRWLALVCTILGSSPGGCAEGILSVASVELLVTLPSAGAASSALEGSTHHRDVVHVRLRRLCGLHPRPLALGAEHPCARVVVERAVEDGVNLLPRAPVLDGHQHLASLLDRRQDAPPRRRARFCWRGVLFPGCLEGDVVYLCRSDPQQSKLFYREPLELPLYLMAAMHLTPSENGLGHDKSSPLKSTPSVVIHCFSRMWKYSCEAPSNSMGAA